ncbi:hypothetical protein HDU97_004667 [Phlyctochytrium planicorne]|nr:hypothetical protein HDU97_004667 [Phlyctochytrium planicorne]
MTNNTLPSSLAPAVANNVPRTPPPSVHEEIFEKPTEKPRRIICVAVDGSDHSKYAFRWALDNLIHKPSESNVQDQVVLLNCRKYYSNSFRSLDTLGDLSVGDSHSNDWFDNLEEANKAESHALLKKFGAAVLELNIPCRAIALRGDSREEIVAKADELGASVIVVGSRGLSPLKRVVLGSVSDYIIHHAHCTVIIPLWFSVVFISLYSIGVHK